MDRPFPANTHTHPAIFLPLIAGFIAISGLVFYLISPVPAYQRERTATATAGEPAWVTTTGRYRTPLPAPQQHWRATFTFTGASGERGFLAYDSSPGADKPTAGETVAVRYLPSPELAGPQHPASTPGRFAAGVTVWSEGRWHFAGWLVSTLISVAAGWWAWARWRATGEVLRRQERGELTAEEAAYELVAAVFRPAKDRTEAAEHSQCLRSRSGDSPDNLLTVPLEKPGRPEDDVAEVSGQR